MYVLTAELLFASFCCRLVVTDFREVFCVTAYVAHVVFWPWPFYVGPTYALIRLLPCVIHHTLMPPNV